MRVAIITDQHFGMRKGSRLFHEYFQRFYEDIFFPTLEREGITTLIDMGDTFDNRRSIDLWSLEWCKTHYFDRLRDLGITVYSVVGNHTAYFKNKNDVNTINLLLREYPNMVLVRDHAEYQIGDTKCLFLGWINEENRGKIKRKVKSTKAKVAFGHLELNGYAVYKGYTQDHGASGDADMFDKFDRVFTGHYHTRSNDGKIFYLGNPYQMYWNDAGDKRGFHIFDTETFELEFIENPYNIFERVYYEDNNAKLYDARNLKDKIVKVIVRKKSSQLQFDKFLDKINLSGCIDLKVVENFTIDDEDVEFSSDECEDTLTLLNKYIEDAEFELDKDVVKGIMKDVYREACEFE